MQCALRQVSWGLSKSAGTGSRSQGGLLKRKAAQMSPSGCGGSSRLERPREVVEGASPLEGITQSPKEPLQ